MRQGIEKVALVICNDMHMDIERANKILNAITNNPSYEVTCDYRVADIVLVYTCAFGPNKVASISILADVKLHSKEGARIIATGCLAICNSAELNALDGIEAMQLADVLKLFNDETSENKSLLPQNNLIISEGCAHRCSYCVYPQFAGKYKSKSLEQIRKEMDEMYNREVDIFITGDLETSCYGIDFHDGTNFATLLEMIVTQYPNCNYTIGWFHPSGLTDEVIDLIAKHKNIAGIMLHIQHVNDNILKSMHRTSFKEVDDKIKKLRSVRNDFFISTEVIVGYPGEGEEQFKELVRYLQKGYFNDIAVASYEPVYGTEAASLPNQVDEETKQSRVDTIKNLFSATCYPATDERDMIDPLHNSIKEKFIEVTKILSELPSRVLKDVQVHNLIAGTDTLCKLEDFMNRLYAIFNGISNARTKFDEEKFKRTVDETYTDEAKIFFYNALLASDFKPIIKERAKRILQD